MASGGGLNELRPISTSFAIRKSHAIYCLKFACKRLRIACEHSQCDFHLLAMFAFCKRSDANHGPRLEAAKQETALENKETNAVLAFKRRQISLAKLTIQIRANKFEVCIEFAGFWHSEFANRIHFANLRLKWKWALWQPFYISLITTVWLRIFYSCQI